MVKHQLPTPLPDETLHSLVSRYHLLTANRRDADTLAQLFGNRHGIPASVLPSHLGNLQKATGQSAAGLEEIRDACTLFPYFRAFAPIPRARLLWEAMQSANGGGMAMNSGLPRAGVAAPSTPQFCPACVEFDRKNYGISYWHRSHQAPGVLVCHLHPDHWLLRRRPTGSDTLRHALYLPREATAEVFPETQGAPPTPIIRLAVLTHDLLNANLSPLDPTAVIHVYRGRLAALGLTTPNGRLRQGAVHERFHAQYATLPTYDPFRALGIRRRSDSDWLASLLRGSRNGTHPVKHLLLIGWLFGDLGGFLQVLRKPRPTSCRTPEGAQGREDGDQDETLRQLLEKEGFSLSEAARRMGVSVTTAQVRAAALGIETSRRRKRTTAEMDQGILKALGEGAAVEQAAERFGVSVTTVYRVLRSAPELRAVLKAKREDQERAKRRERVRDILEGNAEISITEFRRDHPDQYTWFYRHDWRWFRGQFQTRAARANTKALCDWQARDRILAERIRAVALGAYHSGGRPVRVSRALLLRHTRSTATVEKFARLLPRTCAMLAACSESIEGVRIRRIGWAANQLEAQGHEPVAWRVRRLAGLPPATTASVEQALRLAARSGSTALRNLAPTITSETPYGVATP